MRGVVVENFVETRIANDFLLIVAFSCDTFSILFLGLIDDYLDIFLIELFLNLLVAVFLKLDGFNINS